MSGLKLQVDKKFKVYVGIDFGTDGTGLAYALPNGDVFIHQKWKGYKRSVEVKPKTRILLDSDGNFVAFGQPATDSYITVGSKKNWMLFERFKMALYDTSNNKDSQDLKSQLTALNGRSYDSDKVFIEALKYIKDQVFKFFTKNKLNISNIDDVQWILTVPAIWSEKAKYKMEQWVLKAELIKKEIPNHLKIVYEPDCASLSIQHEITELKKSQSFMIKKDNNNNNNDKNDDNKQNNNEIKQDNNNNNELIQLNYKIISENNEYNYMKCELNNEPNIYITKDQYLLTCNPQYNIINKLENNSYKIKLDINGDKLDNVYITNDQLNHVNKDNVKSDDDNNMDADEIKMDEFKIKDKSVTDANEMSKNEAIKNQTYKNANMKEHWTKGERYILVDAGGGTVDVACHEIVDDAIGVKEVVHPTGGPWGSTYIDDEFEKLIRIVFPEEWVNEFSKEDPSGYAELLDNFRHSKQQFYSNEDYKSSENDDDNDKTHNINLPFDFLTFLEDKISQSDEHEEVSDIVNKAIILETEGLFELQEESLTIKYTVWKEFLFSVVTKPIIKHISDLLSQTIMKDNTNYICIVGGLGSSKYLQYLFYKEFGINSKYKINLIIPSRPILSVVDGAARFGLKPDYIQARTLAKTYGNAIDPRIDVIDTDTLPDGYLEQNKYRCDHTKALRVRNIFSIYAKKNQTININDKPIIRKYKRFNKKQKKVRISVFSSDELDPKVVTGKALAKTTIIFPDNSNELSITVELYFSDTKIRVFAYPDDCPNEKKEMELDYDYVK